MAIQRRRRRDEAPPKDRQRDPLRQLVESERMLKRTGVRDQVEQIQADHDVKEATSRTEIQKIHALCKLLL